MSLSLRFCWFCRGEIHRYNNCNTKCLTCNINYVFENDQVTFIYLNINKVYMYTIINTQGTWSDYDDSLYYNGYSKAEYKNVIITLPDYFLCQNSPEISLSKCLEKFKVVEVFG